MMNPSVSAQTEGKQSTKPYRLPARQWLQLLLACAIHCLQADVKVWDMHLGMDVSSHVFIPLPFGIQGLVLPQKYPTFAHCSLRQCSDMRTRWSAFELGGGPYAQLNPTTSTYAGFFYTTDLQPWLNSSDRWNWRSITHWISGQTGIRLSSFELNIAQYYNLTASTLDKTVILLRAQLPNGISVRCNPSWTWGAEKSLMPGAGTNVSVRFPWRKTACSIEFQFFLYQYLMNGQSLWSVYPRISCFWSSNREASAKVRPLLRAMDQLLFSCFQGPNRRTAHQTDAHRSPGISKKCSDSVNTETEILGHAHRKIMALDRINGEMLSRHTPIIDWETSASCKTFFALHGQDREKLPPFLCHLIADSSEKKAAMLRYCITTELMSALLYNGMLFQRIAALDQTNWEEPINPKLIDQVYSRYLLQVQGITLKPPARPGEPCEAEFSNGSQTLVFHCPWMPTGEMTRDLAKSYEPLLAILLYRAELDVYLQHDYEQASKALQSHAQHKRTVDRLYQLAIQKNSKAICSLHSARKRKNAITKTRQQVRDQLPQTDEEVACVQAHLQILHLLRSDDHKTHRYRAEQQKFVNDQIAFWEKKLSSWPFYPAKKELYKQCFSEQLHACFLEDRAIFAETYAHLSEQRIDRVYGPYLLIGPENLQLKVVNERVRKRRTAMVGGCLKTVGINNAPIRKWIEVVSINGISLRFPKHFSAGAIEVECADLSTGAHVSCCQQTLFIRTSREDAAILRFAPIRYQAYLRMLFEIDCHNAQLLASQDEIEQKRMHAVVAQATKRLTEKMVYAAHPNLFKRIDQARREVQDQLMPQNR